jgi:hypothetical protein
MGRTRKRCSIKRKEKSGAGERRMRRKYVIL